MYLCLQIFLNEDDISHRIIDRIFILIFSLILYKKFFRYDDNECL